MALDSTGVWGMASGDMTEWGGRVAVWVVVLGGVYGVIGGDLCVNRGGGGRMHGSAWGLLGVVGEGRGEPGWGAGGGLVGLMVGGGGGLR